MRILVVEDDPEVSRLVRLALSTTGWDTTVVSEGRAGLAQAVAGDFAAVVLDLTLPDVDGMDVLRALRQVSEVPVLILTARGSVTDRVEGLDEGADDYVPKPFQAEELESRLKAILRRTRTRTSPASAAEAYGVEVDPARRQARYRGDLLEITRREFDLLKAFVDRPDVVLTRDMLLEAVWGWGYAGGSNTIDVYVGTLRAKLRSLGAPPLIQTVRGVGYAFRPEDPVRA